MSNIVLLGDPRVGKSSWLKRMQGIPVDINSYITTMDKSVTRMRFNNRDIIVHDIGGYERYHKLLSLNYCIAHGALLFYDVTKKRSKDNLEYWRNKLPKEVPCIVVPNKCDLSSIHKGISCLNDDSTTVAEPLKELLTMVPKPQTTTILEQLLAYLYYFVSPVLSLQDE